MPIITLENVCLYNKSEAVLQDISFQIESGDYIGLVGPNGAGKSTLLKLILGIIETSSGCITIDPMVRFGYVPQDYLPGNTFTFSVREVLETGLDRRTYFRKKAELNLLIEKLVMVGLDESYLHKAFEALSGGQKQRVMIARALVAEPNLLLFDEPLSGVDLPSKIKIYDLLADINKRFGIAIIFVSHEIDQIVENCHRILCLNKHLHEGCHAIDFLHGKITKIDAKNKHVHPIHHHHNINHNSC